MEGTFIDGKYEVIRQLGQGGMGAVYEARHRSTGRRVALKVIVPAALVGGPDIIARFEREARASGSIDSPFVVQVFDAGVDPATGAPYMAMECLAGEDVQAAVARVGPLLPEVVLKITAQACHGLQKAHEAGIVHRDIKSANLFLARREDSDELVTKILDFGIAKVRASPLAPGEDHHLTKTGAMLGSPTYMSPEQAIGANDLDARSDIFSMGVMMYEALAGATPNGHLENLGALLLAICSRPATPIQDRAPWVPAEVAAIVHKALALSPADRYQSATELRAATVALLPGGGTTLAESELVAIAPEVKSQRARVFTTTAGVGTSSVLPKPIRWGAVMGSLAAALALGGGAMFYAQHQRAEVAPDQPLALAAEVPSAVPVEATIEVDGSVEAAAPTPSASAVPAAAQAAVRPAAAVGIGRPATPPAAASAVTPTPAPPATSVVSAAPKPDAPKPPPGLAKSRKDL